MCFMAVLTGPLGGFSSVCNAQEDVPTPKQVQGQFLRGMEASGLSHFLAT